MPKNYKGYSKKMPSGPAGTKAPHIPEDDDLKYTSYHANMPTGEMMAEYPKAHYGIDSYYNDNVYGLDRMAEMNEKQIKKQMNDPYRGR